MPSEVKAQDTTSLASIKTVNEAATQSRALLAEMEQAAVDAGTTLDGIYQDAKDAQTAADSAKQSADTAYTNLSQIQSVLEVAQWIATHGTYVKATTFNPNATYYTITATQVATPSDDDKDSQGVLIYYELDNGIYVRTTDTSVQSGKTYYNVTGTPVAQPSAEHIADYYTLNVSEAMADYVQSHLALTDDGLYVMKDDSKWKVQIADDGVYILDPNNDAANQMTSNGIIVGYEDEARIEVTSIGQSLVDEYGNPWFEVVAAPTASANSATMLGDGVKTKFVIASAILSTRSVKVDNVEMVEGVDYTRKGNVYTFTTPPADGSRIVFAYNTPAGSSEIYYTIGIRDEDAAKGFVSSVMGSLCEASGWYSHAEGEQSKATSTGAHSEGRQSVASGSYSHAEGYSNASGDCAHSEGGFFNANYGMCEATGQSSHAEGYRSIASGPLSHAQNEFAIARKRAQTALGTYNIEDTSTTTTHPSGINAYGKHAVIVGNGTSSARSNAFTIDWDGIVSARNKAGVFGDIFDLLRPVGSTYETVDANFDPNVSWGGTWEKLPEGYVLLAGSESGTYKVGKDTSKASGYKEYGENSHTLTINEMPSHTHIQNQHRHNMGSNWSSGSGSAAAYMTTSNRSQTTHYTSYETPTNQNTGGGQAHSIMQKSIAVYIWIRTA